VTADSVEREILIEASPEVVWGVITEPEQISCWFSDEAVSRRAPARRVCSRGGVEDVVEARSPTW
jgi:uncharacterized protein YndB with AHSA1/START domain